MKKINKLQGLRLSRDSDRVVRGGVSGNLKASPWRGWGERGGRMGKGHALFAPLLPYCFQSPCYTVPVRASGPLHLLCHLFSKPAAAL